MIRHLTQSLIDDNAKYNLAVLVTVYIEHASLLTGVHAERDDCHLTAADQLVSLQNGLSDLRRRVHWISVRQQQDHCDAQLCSYYCYHQYHFYYR